MTSEVKAIWLTESLADAAQLMWQNDCGALPIIRDGNNVIGMITDRDICMAASMRDRTPSSISVEEVMTGQVYAVQPDDDIDHALKSMAEHQIRRLPVIDPEGELVGLLSINDIVRHANAPDENAAEQINYSDVVTAYQTICKRQPTQTATAAAAS
jgi:CBS-domain-containing membrane protein